MRQGKTASKKQVKGGEGRELLENSCDWRLTANILLKQERLQLAEASYCDYTYIACIYYIT